MRFACRSASSRLPPGRFLTNGLVISAAFERNRLSIIDWACAEHPSIVRPSSCAICSRVLMVCVHKNCNRFFSLVVHGAGRLTLSASPGATTIFSFFLCQDDPSAVIRRCVYPVVRRDMAVCSCGNPTKRFDFARHLSVIDPTANGSWSHMHHLGEGVCADAVLVQIIGEFHSHIVPACTSLRQDKLRYREIILVTWRFPVVSRWQLSRNP